MCQFRIKHLSMRMRVVFPQLGNNAGAFSTLSDTVYKTLTAVAKIVRLIFVRLTRKPHASRMHNKN
jgi:hypothetical protein